MSDLSTMEGLQALVVAHGMDDDYDWTQHGDVRMRRNDDRELMLFCYKQSTMYAGRWNWFERASRGLIMNATTGEVVARPFDKFFNHGERPDDVDHGPIVDVSEKMDGSLGILYRHKGEYRIATKGAFDSEQAIWATERLDLTYDLAPSLTLLFEIIYPGNRIVVDYGASEGLCLLAIRDRHTGVEWGVGQRVGMAAVLGLNTPARYLGQTIDGLTRAAEALDVNQEGWVVRYADGHRVKIKGAAYVALHRILTNMTPDRIAAEVIAGRGAKLRDAAPERFWPEIDEASAKVSFLSRELNVELTQAYLNTPKKSRKGYAIHCQQRHAELFHALMKFYDGAVAVEQCRRIVEARYRGMGGETDE